MSLNASTLHITPEGLSLIAEINKFKGAWRAARRIAPGRLSSLCHVARFLEPQGGTRFSLMTTTGTPAFG